MPTRTMSTGRRVKVTSLLLAASCLTRMEAQTTTVPSAITVKAGSMQHGALPHPLRPPVPVGRPVVGITFEGGGALGLAHIGVMRWMDEHHIPVDRISGTSMGALIGSLIASGAQPSDLQRLATSGILTSMFTLKPSLDHLSFRRREDRNELPQAFTIGLRGGHVTVGNALLTDDALNAFLSGQLVAYNSDALSFNDLPIPFRCVSTDLTTLRPLVFDSGSLPFAVRASISIPGVFPPVRYKGDILVDGAITDNMPVDVLRNDLHADVTIAVHLADSSFGDNDAQGITGVFARALQAGTSRNEEISRSQSDIQILPAVATFSAADYGKAVELEQAGYVAAEAQRDRLLPYALSNTDWASYEADLASRKRLPPTQISAVRVEAAGAPVPAEVVRRADKLQGQSFHEAQVEALVSDLRGNGAQDAFYSISHAPAEQGAVPAQTTPQDGVVIHLRNNLDGPPYLLFGTDLAAMNANVTSAVFDLRFVDQNLGSYGAELRSDVRLGYLTQLGTEYYQPLGGSPFYVQPHVLYLRQPVYEWLDQKRVAERMLQRAGGGFDVGVTLNRKLQAALQYQAATVRWVLKEGQDESPTQHLSGTTQSAAVHVIYTDRVAEIASPTGTRIDLTAGHLLHTAGSNEAPFADLKARHSFTFLRQNLLILSTQADTYFRNLVADPFRFTLGGPLRLSASSVDEYRGTDTVLGQATYLRRIANLPSGLGQGIYLTTAYEVGSIWSPERHSILRQDQLAGLLLNTPLGALTLGGAIGDAGHRKVFFTFGKVF